MLSIKIYYKIEKDTVIFETKSRRKFIIKNCINDFMKLKDILTAGMTIEQPEIQSLHNEIIKINKLVLDEKEMIKEHTQVKYEDFDYNISGRLFNVQFDIESKCNFKCIHCIRLGSQNYNKNLKLSLIRLRSLFDEFERLGVDSLTFSGGEPFLNKEFLEILNLTKNYGFKIIIYTNGSLITNEAITILKSIRLYNLRISIYGNRDDYIKVTSVDVFETVMNNIAMLKKAEIEFVLECALLKQNTNSIPFFNELGKKHTSQYYYVISNPKYYCEKDYTAEYGVDINNPKLYIKIPKIDKGKKYNVDNKTKCIIGDNGPFIDIEGYVYPCYKFPINIGNLHLLHFSEIWFNNKALIGIKEINCENVFTDCLNCLYSEYCTRCLAYNLVYEGDMRKNNRYTCSEAIYTYNTQNKLISVENEKSNLYNK